MHCFLLCGFWGRDLSPVCDGFEMTWGVDGFESDGYRMTWGMDGIGITWGCI